jgi:hypothetical protein
MPMPSSRKKVIVRKFNREWQAGYLPAAHFADEDGLELLDLAGKVAMVALKEIKWICYVRDFNSGEADNPERLLRKSYLGRPRSEGLWLRLRLTDGDSIEGMASNDLTLLDGAGIFIVPPDIRSNTQRMFIPQSSIAEFVIAAAIAAPARRNSDERPRQEDLFE